MSRTKLEIKQKEYEDVLYFPIKKKRKVTKKMIVNWQMKKYEEKLKLKLPNEFSKCLDGYNHRNTSDSWACVDDNQY